MGLRVHECLSVYTTIGRSRSSPINVRGKLVGKRERLIGHVSNNWVIMSIASEGEGSIGHMSNGCTIGKAIGAEMGRSSTRTRVRCGG